MSNLPEELSDDKINELREVSQGKTMRTISPGLEEVLYKPFKVLDHGFVRVIDYMGTDSSIVQAARVSYGAGTKKVNEDRGLINYLMRHQHTTPFEMCEIKLHVRLPIFVARQWIRHRTASVNEYSARYSVLNNEFYVPEPENISIQSTINKQGRSLDDKMDENHSALIKKIIKEACEDSYAKYSNLINNYSLTRELARTILPVNVYSEWYWKIDLHNLLHFLKLRADPHAQYEIRCYADIILDLVKKWVPFTYEAFINYKKDSAVVSKKNLDLLKRLLKGEKVNQDASGLSKGEWAEFIDTFDLKNE